MKQYYAATRWMIEDVQAIRPEWTEKQCHDWWKAHEKAFSDILTEYGNECLQYMVNQTEE